MPGRGDRREVKKHEDKCGMVASHKKRGQGRGKDAGGLHACLKTTSRAAF